MHAPNAFLLDINNLMTAISEKNTKLAVEILESDSPINVNELVSVDMFNDTFTWSPLHAAAYYGETKVIKALMAKNANVEIHDTWYEGTPLAWSAFGGNVVSVGYVGQDALALTVRL